MSNEIRVTGNVGGNPEMKPVNGKDVCNFSIFCDEYKYNEEKKEYEANGGEWYEVAVWRPDLAKAVFETIRKGARVDVIGHLRTRTYKTKDEPPKDAYALQINAEDVLHRLNRVEEIVLRAKKIEPAMG
mgnify:FL=1